jgi:hypothetical protein
MPKLNGEPFRIAFPLIRLPENLGGRSAIILASQPHPENASVFVCVAVDEVGNVHTLSLMAPAILKAQRDHLAHFVEIPSPTQEAPKAAVDAAAAKISPGVILLP